LVFDPHTGSGLVVRRRLDGRRLVRASFAVEVAMNTNERQLAISLLEGLREDLTYARLNNGGRVLDVADLRQYIYEQIGRIRTNAYFEGALYGNSDGKGQAISKSNGHNGKAYL
jgi:hypothetical protein